MGLCYRTSVWLDRLWSEHLDISQSARDLLQQGIARQGPPFAGFPADVHARLYLPSDPAGLEAAPAWATRLHDLASELGEWQRLRLMCSRNGFAAGTGMSSAGLGRASAPRACVLAGSGPGLPVGRFADATLTGPLPAQTTPLGRGRWSGSRPGRGHRQDANAATQ